MDNIIKYSFWYWKNLISLNKIKLINKTILKQNLVMQPEEHAAHDGKNKNKKNLHCYLLEYNKIKPLLFEYVEQFVRCNEINFGFDVFNLKDFTILNYNIYDSKNKANYDWHVDQSTSLVTDFKLTCLINLSEKKFEGGDFILYDGNEVNVPEFKEPGSVFMFRSHILHKVTPVTSGVRKTLTIFLEGPRLR